MAFIFYFITTIIMFLSLTVNFILYLQDWSTSFRDPVYSETYILVGILQLLFCIVAIKDNEHDKLDTIKLKKIRFNGIRVNISDILLITCILFCAIENIYVQGSLFAKGSALHTASMPIIGPALRALYPIAYIYAFVDLTNHQSIPTLVLLIVCIVYSVIGGQGRFWCVCSLICMFIFITFYKISIRYKKDKKQTWFSNLKLRYKVLFIIALLVAGNYLLNMGVMRISTLTFSDVTGYNGPWKKTVFGEIFAWYYGYFPFSYYNLNVTLHNILTNNLCTYGGFLFYPFLSVLKVDSLFNVDYTVMTKNARVVQNNAATVATGFFEGFSDFRWAFLISIIILLVFTFQFRGKKKLWGYISYSYMLTVWLFMSFLNIFTVGIPIYVLIFSWIFDKLFAVHTS